MHPGTPIPGSGPFAPGPSGLVLPSSSAAGSLALAYEMPSYAVPMSADLARVMALPRRVWTEEAKIALAAWLTDGLRTGQGCDKCGGQRQHAPWPSNGTYGPPGCWYFDPRHPARKYTAPPIALRPVQAVVLWELYLGKLDGGYGVYMQIPVSGGKTLIFYLAPYVVGAQRPMLLVPGALKQDTYDKFELYHKYWRAPYPLPRIESFQQLTQRTSVDMLGAAAPDLLGADECDKAKALDRSAAKRIGRYVDEVRGACQCLFGSGTNKRKSLADDNHFMTWCLRDRTPGALDDNTLADWCSALDEESKVGAGRLHPGALLLLADQMRLPHEQPEAPSIGMLARAREGYRLRVEQTRGIVIHDVPECDQPITITFQLAPADEQLDAHFQHFRDTSERPDGVLVPEAIRKASVAQEMGVGLFYYWDPAAPEEWLRRRKKWHKFVAWEIYSSANTASPLDTEMAVANEYPDHPDLLAWREAKATTYPGYPGPFEPNSVPGWLSSSVVLAVAAEARAWATGRDNGGVPDTGLIWCKHKAFALALSQSTGLPYYGPKGERIDQYGRGVPGDTIEATIKAAAKRGVLPPIAILSIDANLRGRNLQAYANNIIVGWEQAGTRTEQLLGRTHRSGQARPISVKVFVTCGETLDAFYRTLSEARFVRSQGLTQKILSARIDRSGLRAYPAGPRWIRRGDTQE